MKTRLIVTFFCVFAMLAGLLIRAAYLQILPNEKLAQLQTRQFKGVIELQPRRGAILDRSQMELASSVTAYSLYADPQLIDSPKKVSRRLAARLGTTINHMYDKLKDPKRRFVWIQRRMDEKVKEEIASWQIPGLAFVEEAKRIYPYERFLAPVIGFVGGEGQGLEGIEARFNSELHGETKKVSIRRDARGRPLVVNGQLFSEAPDGMDITLTIDTDLQYALENELAGALRKHRAQSAVGVVLDVKTSEILAMSSVPSFDPNLPRSADPEDIRNRTVTDPFEPGSTMKTFTLAAALEGGEFAPNSKIYCEKGTFKIGKRTIRESDTKHKWEWLTINEILAVSSNVGTSKVALSLGSQKLESTLRAFGFGEKSGVELTGESRGVLPQGPWRDHLLANISFGHGISATAIQVANAYAAIANGGVLRKPFIVRSIRNRETGHVDEFTSKDVRQVISAKTAATLKLMLMNVTADGGTGMKARVNGYPVAGKTGTAQKVGPDGRYTRAYISSFAGFIPANDPRFVIFIAVDDPKDGYYGSDVAAPVFASVASVAVRKNDLAPTLFKEEDVMKVGANYESGELKADLKKSKEVSAKLTFVKSKKDAGLGTKFVDDSLSSESVANSETLPEGRVRVPNIKGLTLREALQKMREAQLEVVPKGRGRVVSLYPPAASIVPKSTHVSVLLQ